jgi:cyclic pyranopterin phosphate synthase
MTNKKILKDSFGREINYVRLSVTDHCNLACTYCREEDHKITTKKENILSFEEIERMAKILSGLGISKIRLTGGEPLLRKNIDLLISNLNKISGIDSIPLSTNGVLLTANAKKLSIAGLKKMNISIDTLDQEKFKKTTRGGDILKVIEGIDESISVGITQIKINSVVTRDTTPEDIVKLFNFAKERDLTLRFIETMPIGRSGIESVATHLMAEDIKNIISKETKAKLIPITAAKTDGPAKTYVIDGTNARVGFINAVSNTFCATCNRIRISSTGKLLLCLGQENSVDLMSLLRDETISDEDIRKVIYSAIQKKPKEHYFSTDINNINTAQMVEIGG